MRPAFHSVIWVARSFDGMSAPSPVVHALGARPHTIHCKPAVARRRTGPWPGLDGGTHRPEAKVMASERPDPIELTHQQRATIDALQQSHEAIPPPDWMAKEASIDYEAEVAFAAGDPRVFWARKARLIEWNEPFSEVLSWDPPHHTWFAGGRLNATVSCIDRHVHSERRNKAALIWVGEDGEEHAYTYNRLYREVNRFANALRRLGVRKGDRVVLYMPLVPEGIISMLACARIGAIHSAVYAGMGTQALSPGTESEPPTWKARCSPIRPSQRVRSSGCRIRSRANASWRSWCSNPGWRRERMWWPACGIMCARSSDPSLSHRKSCSATPCPRPVPGKSCDAFSKPKRLARTRAI